jgi:hypothetical protein
MILRFDIMAGQKINVNGSAVCIDYHDGEGAALVNGREWLWDFHEYLGPTFLRQDRQPLARQPGEKHPVWDAFAEWLPRYQQKRKTAKQSDIISA